MWRQEDGMSRVHDSSPARAVGRGFNFIPARLTELVKVEFVIGIDPVFAGIHKFKDWRRDDLVHQYKDTAHCVLDVHQMHRPLADRNVKIVLPSNRNYDWDGFYGLHTVIHEFGHAVQDSFNLYAHRAAPVSDYAHTNNNEAFAEAFADWCLDGPVDEETRALFERLAWN
jgi:hypothetical protein